MNRIARADFKDQLIKDLTEAKTGAKTKRPYPYRLFEEDAPPEPSLIEMDRNLKRMIDSMVDKPFKDATPAPTEKSLIPTPSQNPPVAEPKSILKSSQRDLKTDLFPQQPAK